jgi:hypothetical protein
MVADFRAGHREVHIAIAGLDEFDARPSLVTCTSPWR